jgi:DNA replication initiation complex subunit (GINS family)
LKPPDEEDFYGDVEKEIEDLDKEVDPDMGLDTGTSASQIDPHITRRK